MSCFTTSLDCAFISVSRSITSTAERAKGTEPWSEGPRLETLYEVSGNSILESLLKDENLTLN